jgi:hypothetical protein
MPRSSASLVADPFTQCAVLSPSAAIVTIQDELSWLSLDDDPQRPKAQLSVQRDQERPT